MNLSELKKEAQRILDIPEEVGGYQNHSFSCGSGGSPENRVNVPEVHRSDDFAYHTTANGNAIRGEVVVLCRDSGAMDATGKKIYTTPGGVVFVYKYYSGSPSAFDFGCLEEPKV